MSATPESEAGMPRALLLLPVSGSAGTGEMHRAVLLARAARARWPGIRCGIVAAAQASVPDDVAEVFRIAGSPTHAGAQVDALMQAFRPDAVVVDSGGRTAQLRAARALGAATVFVSSRPSARRRGFRWSRLAATDQLWLIGPDALVPALRWHERLKLRWWREAEVVRIGSLFETPDRAAALRRLQAAGLSSRGFVLFCPGGGGQRVGSRTAAGLFAAAAVAFTRASGAPALVIGAEGDAVAVPSIAVPAVPNAELMALLGEARVAVLAGGSLLVQALASATPTVACPLQDEQAERVAKLASLGATVVATTSPEAIAATAAALWHDEARRAAVVRAAQAQGVSNGLPLALDALARAVAKRRAAS